MLMSYTIHYLCMLSLSCTIFQERSSNPASTEAKVTDSAKSSSSSSQQEIPHHPQHPTSTTNILKDELMPRSPTPTMKTESVDTDSASISASTSPAPSSSQASPPPPPQQPPASGVKQQLQVALKILVSNTASGYIIGRSGATISDLQAKSYTRIKLSQGGDYYPGTSDRTCLIQGLLPNVSVAVEMVLAKLYELQSSQQQIPSSPSTTNPIENTSPDDEDTALSSTAPSFIVRILLPTTCCGMIIGRGGSNIKTLKEQFGTHIQLSPKGQDQTMMIGRGLATLPTSERIMTITGSNFSSCVNCIRVILNDMALSPELSRYINMTTSYTKNLVATVPVASSYVTAPTASGFFPGHEIHEQFDPSSPPRASGIGLLSPEQLQGSPAGYNDVPMQQVLGDPASTMMQSQPYGMMTSSPPRFAAEVNPSSSSYPQYQQTSQASQFWSPPQDTSPTSAGRMSSSGHMSPEEQLSHNFQAQASIQSHPSHSSLQQLSVGSQQQVVIQAGVPDNRIGAILGRGGKTLTEIQALSHTKIRISQRGEFFRGTQNRVVTITGDTVQDVEHAQHLLNQRLAGAHTRSTSWKG